MIDLDEMERQNARAREIALDYIAHAFNRTDRERPRHRIPAQPDDHDAALMAHLRDTSALIVELRAMRKVLEASAEPRSQAPKGSGP